MALSSGPCGVGGVGGKMFSDDDMLFVVCLSKVLSHCLCVASAALSCCSCLFGTLGALLRIRSTVLRFPTCKVLSWLR